MNRATRCLTPIPLLAATLATLLASPAGAQVTAIRAGLLVDPEAGTATPDQVVLVEDGHFTAGVESST